MWRIPTLGGLGRVGRHSPPVVFAPFTVIAGGNGGGGYNPWLEGDDDGLVRVVETSLVGGRHVHVRGVHTTLMKHPHVLREVLG